MPDWLYNLLTSTGIYYVIAVWLLICIAWKSRREHLSKTLIELVSKPIIFEPDNPHEAIAFYPRGLLEKVASAFQRALVMPLDGIIQGLKRWLRGLINLIYNKERPWRTFGYFLFLVLMLVFILADAIAIANALDVAGWIPYELPPILQRYEIAAAMGSLFAIITGVFVFSEINRERSVFTDWDITKGAWRQLARAMSVYLVIFGFIVVLFLGLQRFQALEFFPNTNLTTKVGVSVVILIIVPLNTVVATALIAEEGFKGFMLIVIVVLTIVLGALYVLNYAAYLTGYLLPFTVDILWRIVLFLANIVVYIIITPIDFVVSILTLPFRMLRPEEEPNQTSSNKKNEH